MSTINENLHEVSPIFHDDETAFELDEIYTWAQVSKVHRVRNGIYQRKEHLISLLTDFGKINPCYPDVATENGNVIFYTGNGRTGDQPLNPSNRALLKAIETKHKVPLFNKLAVGQWKFTGLWRVTHGEYVFDETTQRMVWRFTLEKQVSI
ncbi:MAG: hypothetical protein H7Z37_10595 [Pyrinomonadaceae bacterium]|nr:hypothetical protein [Pyrinomonadaceae bacterium]